MLRQVGEGRPEFRAGVAKEIVPAILSKFQAGEFWTGIAEAFKVGLLYLDVLDATGAREIISGTLALLNRVDPAQAAWVIVQPAIDLLPRRPHKIYASKIVSLMIALLRPFSASV